MFYRICCLLFGCLIMTVYADDNELITSPSWPELDLITEHPIEDMPDGNLSGMAVCDGKLWAISDRSDQQIYQLIPQQSATQEFISLVLRAEAVNFSAPTAPKNGLPWWGGVANFTIGQFRGGILDFEGVSCDREGNRYLVSEAYLAVLKLPKQGDPEWLSLPNELWQQANENGLLQKANQTFEGIAVDPDGQRLWLAAERNKRGILSLVRTEQGWQCPDNKCVLLVEAGREAFPKQFRRKRVDVRDFSDLVFYKEKLFTLERSAYRVCRRSLEDGQVEKCWSFARDSLQPQRQYKAYGMPEALWIDEQGAWIGVDNDTKNKRIDGEDRPIVWRFIAPKEGWEG